jgi:hypothetical protein
MLPAGEGGHEVGQARSGGREQDHRQGAGAVDADLEYEKGQRDTRHGDHRVQQRPRAAQLLRKGSGTGGQRRQREPVSEVKAVRVHLHRGHMQRAQPKGQDRNRGRRDPGERRSAQAGRARGRPLDLSGGHHARGGGEREREGHHRDGQCRKAGGPGRLAQAQAGQGQGADAGLDPDGQGRRDHRERPVEAEEGHGGGGIEQAEQPPSFTAQGPPARPPRPEPGHEIEHQGRGAEGDEGEEQAVRRAELIRQQAVRHGLDHDGNDHQHRSTHRRPLPNEAIPAGQQATDGIRSVCRRPGVPSAGPCMSYSSPLSSSACTRSTSPRTARASAPTK